MTSASHPFDVDQAIETWIRFVRFERTISSEDLAELEDHLRHEVRVLLMRGHSPENAFHEALRRMGDFATVGEAFRRVYFEKQRRDGRLHHELAWMLTMLKNYFTTGIRHIRNHAGFAFINVAGLAVGMACCILILLYVRYELSFDDFHEKADQIYRLVEKQTFSGRTPEHIGLTMGPMGPALMEDYPEVIGFVRFLGVGDLLARYEGENLYLGSTWYADQAALDWFDYPLLAGDRSTALVEPGSIVISSESARALFGDESAVGKVIEADDAPFTVTGVLGEMPTNSHLQFRALISYSTTRDNPRWEWLYAWRSNNLVTYVSLDPTAEKEALESRLSGFAVKYLGDRADNYEFYLQPLRDVHLRSEQINYDNNWYKGDASSVWSFSAIALLVLVIACINFMNLATARSSTRAREVGMRKVAGAHRRQLVLQFISESAVMALLATAVAIIIVALVAPAFSHFVGRDVELSLLSEPALILSAVLLGIVVGVFSGTYPALFLSRMNSIGVLRSAISSRSGSSRLRRILVVVQFAITIVLINATILAARQFDYMRSKNLGYNIDQVVSLWIPGVIRSQFDAFRSELTDDPSIADVTSSRQRLGAFIGETSFTFEGANPEEEWITPYVGVDYNFFDFYDLEVTDGRAFSPEFPSDTSEAGAFIINETLARKLGWDDPVGRLIGLGRGADVPLGPVIGLVKDYHFYSLHHPIEPIILFAQAEGAGSAYVKLNAERTEEALAHLDTVWTKFAPGWPLEYSFMDELYAEMYYADRRTSRLFSVLAIIAIVIACLGLVGLAAFTAERRTREIGVRKAMGASEGSVVMLLSGEFTRLVGIAIILAVPVTWLAMSKWLDNYAYHVELSWVVLLAGGVVAVMIAWLSVSYQAIRAARANPVDALRMD